MARHLIFLCALAGCSSGHGTDQGGRDLSQGGGGDLAMAGDMAKAGDMAMGGGACAPGGAEVTSLPQNCAGGVSAIQVGRGCTPTVDGTVHLAEWQDASCFGVGDYSIYWKYDDAALYFVAIGPATCGCGISFLFDPDGGATLDGDEFAVVVADDPFGANGDRSDFTPQNGQWSKGTAPAGIVTACPGNQPTPDRFEWKVPLSALGVTPGSAHAFGFAFVHSAVSWPAGLAATGNFSTDPSTWGKVSSSASWQ